MIRDRYGDNRGRTRWAVMLLAASLAILVAAAATERTTGEALGAQETIALGASIEGAPWTPSRIDGFSRMVGQRPTIVMWYESWSDHGFDARRFDAVASRGAMPMVTWEPWDPRYGARQPRYSLQAIASGRHDAYVRRWAQGAAAWDRPFYLRFAHEMNGGWYPWGVAANGNTPAQYVAAWRRVHGIFRQEGATNVRWVWCPNVGQWQASYARVYPGNAYVDWVALDGYNWGKARPSGWQPLTEVFGPSHDALARLTTKPMMIAETSSAEVGGDKGAWIRSGLLRGVPNRLPRVRAVVWFHHGGSGGHPDFRVNTSQGSLAAYGSVARSSLYR